MLPFIPAQMSVEQKGLGDSAMGDGVHAIVSVEQPITVQDQSLQTTYYPWSLPVLPILWRSLSSSSYD